MWGRRKDKELVALAQEGRRKGWFDDAMAIVPPEVRKAVHEAERKAARAARRK